MAGRLKDRVSKTQLTDEGHVELGELQMLVLKVSPRWWLDKRSLAWVSAHVGSVLL